MIMTSEINVLSELGKLTVSQTQKQKIKIIERVTLL